MAPRRRASSSSQAAQQSLSRGWTQFLESTGDVYVDLVREFYAQVVTVDANVEELTIQVRGVFFTLSANIIAQFIGLLRPQVPAYPTIGPSFDMTSEEVWKERRNITVRPQLGGGFLLVMVARRTPIDLPALIVQQILRDARSTSERDGLPHGLLISRMLVAAGVPILPDEKIRSPIGPLCRSTFSCSVAHLHRGGANVNDDVDPDEVAMDEGPPPHSHPTRRGEGPLLRLVRALRAGGASSWMDTLLDEFTMRMDVRFKKIEEEIRELRKERDNA
ncbi:hypothetical protein CJ030_MR1G009586 [Morella rubra]|uniref:Uncharacterized protein n=1 Tax=Morella rubra TaxID=262757 RepID=A0A6A1WP31_9ROSI|nr:hypothetical protein CJ030_MR1G009586 [Morella rubra]